MEKVLVIGGSGFLGVHTARRLAEEGYGVWATHSPGKTQTPLPGVSWLATDLTGAQVAVNWPTQCDAIFFLAQARNWRRFPECAHEVVAVNLNSLHQTVQYALKCGARRLVVASTGSVYAASSQPMRESDAIDSGSPRNFYASSKLAAEILLAPYAKQIPIVQYRIFMPYGPGIARDGLFSQLVERVRSNQPISLHGQDGMRINPVWAGDVAEVFLRSLGLLSSETLNLGGPAEYTLRDVGETIGKVLGLQPRFEVQADATAPCVVGDISRLRKVLGWAPTVSLADGMRAWLGASMNKQAA